MRRAGKERRNLFILLLMVAGLAVLVRLAMKQADIRVMPPESPEIAAKRKSPDNAFYMLRSARTHLEKVPIPPQPSEAKTRPARGPMTIREILGDWLANNDPRLAEFLGKAEPAIGKVRKAFAKPYYLCPEVGRIRGSTLDRTVDFRDLGYLLTARGLHRAGIEQADEAAFEYFLDGLRLGRMVASDGPFASYYCGVSIQSYALKALPEVAVWVDSTDVLRAVLDTLLPLTVRPVSVRQALEFQWRMIDNALVVPRRKDQAKRKRHRRPRQYLRDYRFAWEVKRGQWFLIKHRERFREKVTLSYPEYRQWIQNRPEMANARHPYLDIRDEMDRLVLFRTVSDARGRGARIALALELYRREHEAYPAGLDALTPGYLPQVPADPFTGHPFIYRVEDGDYWLYSLGENARDDDGRDDHEADTLVHKPIQDK